MTYNVACLSTAVHQSEFSTYFVGRNRECKKGVGCMKVINYLYSVPVVRWGEEGVCGYMEGENTMKLEINIFISNTEICRSVMGHVQAVLQCTWLTKALTNCVLLCMDISI
jgi:hypothetical protein